MRAHGAAARSAGPARGFAVAGVVLLLVMLGGVAASAVAGGSAHQGPTPEQPPSDEVVTSGPQAVAGPDGVVGWIDEQDWEQATLVGPPVRSFGSAGVELQSLDVHDEAGTLVGYYTTGRLGFIPLATAEDPAAMDVLLEQAAAHP